MKDNSKWEVIPNMKSSYIFKKRILILFVLIAGFLMIPGSTAAYDRPPFSDGLAEKWHPGSFCIPCHYTIAGDEKARSISTGCQCHKYQPKNPVKPMQIDMTKILDIHINMVCIKCHVGQNKNISNLKAADFHMVMKRIACTKCHTIENGKAIKPKAKICSDCHAVDPHVVHGKKLEKICMACHGEFGERFVNKSIDPSEKIRLPSTIAKLETNEDVLAQEYSSVGDYINKLLSSIIQTIR
jgi:hypothetical protein